MPPVLYQGYTPEEAIRAFGSSASAGVRCGGRFVVMPGAILVLATVGTSPFCPRFASPSCFIWSPPEAPRPGDTCGWLPVEVRDAPRRHTPHHLFVRARPQEKLLYVGGASLASYGVQDGRAAARFELHTKLPRTVWLEMGGYPGWEVGVSHATYRVDSADGEGFARLLQQMPQQSFSHLTMTRYEEDSLYVFTNSHRGWLMYLRCPEDTGLAVRTPGVESQAQPTELFRCSCGIDLDFPFDQTLPREDALHLAAAFFSTGILPQYVSWEEG